MNPSGVSRDTRIQARALDFPPLEGPVDPERYMLGPGDELELALSGRVNVRVPVAVNAEGSIFVPNLGHVRVGGLTIAAARARLSDEFRKGYRGVQADITLIRPRRILIHVAGEVGRPGLVELQGPARVSEAVKAAAGFTGRASRRNLVVERAGGGIDSADLDRYTMLGLPSENPYLDDGDVVRVPALLHSVEIRGEVVRPGILEFRSGDRLSEVLALAGGTRAGADSESVEVWRFVSSSESRSLTLPLRPSLEAPGSPSDPLVEPDDRIYVRRVADWHRGANVQVVGEAVRPGAYAISPEGERASDLITRFGGFTRYADLGGVAVFRAGLLPTRDSSFATVLRAGGSDAPGEDAEFLRARAQAQGTLSIRFRKLVLDRDRSADFDLRDGDVVSIPSRTGSVAIYGAVKRPGAVPFRPGADLEDYIRDAGGYGKRADRGKIRVTKVATGQPVRAADVASVEEGDLVWVPERGHTSFIKAVGNVTGFLAQIATIYLVIDQATK